MFGVSRLSRRARWAVPVGALVITGGVMAGSLVSVAQAAPSLPSRTPAQLLAAVAQGQGPELSGTVVETASLGLPSLPGGNDPTSIASLLTGSHTVQVWYASPEHYRLALPGTLSESDVIRNGNTVWLWQSAANSVTEISVPAHQATHAPVPAVTPQQAAQQVLAAVGPTTTVSVDSNVTVAGQPAYELVLAPKDSRSLIGQVRIAIDGHNSVPLRVEVFARGAASPAISVGYTSVQFTAPAASELSFTPPSGAKITKVNADQGGQADQGSAPAGSVIGSGWLAVLDVPSAGLPSPLQTLLGSAKYVHGTWGTGRLLSTSLVSVLMTSNGTTFVGAVEPSVLYAAATQASSGHRPVASPATAP
jgi:outer membrane lipoprotein-sorting protein